MAVATAAKANGTGSSGTTVTASTGTVSIDPGESVLVFFASFRSTIGPAAAATISDTAGVSWTEVNPGGWTLNFGTNPFIRIQAWVTRNNSGSTISTTVTCTSTTASGTLSSGIAAVGITGNSTTITNFGSSANAAGDPAPSMANAPAATSAAVGFGAFTGSVVLSAPTGFTELQAFQAASVRRFQTIHDDSSPAQTATWSSTDTNSLGVLIEIPIASAAANQSAFMAVL